MKTGIYLVVNCIKTEVKRNEMAAIRSAEAVSPHCRTIVYEFRPRNASRIIWDTGRERVMENV